MRRASQGIDVIVTAGDRRGSRPVLGENKAFLPINGIPVILHVLSSVEQACCTIRIFVVGDKGRLERILATPNTPFQKTRPLVLIEQSNTLYDNVWKAFLHTLPDYAPGKDWQPYLETEAVDKAVLVMPGDIPLSTPFEIDEFVEGCDLTRYDYCLGLTTESTLRAYTAQDGRPGIDMAYFTLRDMQTRHNNLHLVKPLRLGNRVYIQKMYELRYQREWFNILKLCWELWRLKDASVLMLWSFLRLHIARFMTRWGGRDAFFCRPFYLDLQMAASQMSQLLRTRFTTVETHYGGCTLDVDNAEHYEAICTNFELWQDYQYAIAKELKQQL